ncbi:MAG TPA: hypothetical protein VF843_14220 [Streptosporangiaceae bacterium]
MSATRGLARAEEELRAVAGDRSFERGLRYVGAVTGLEHAGDKVLATVRGAQDYLVVLTVPGGRVARPGLRGECGCPYGQEGFFCKHCVAVGLVVARGTGALVPAPRAEPGGPRNGGPVPAGAAAGAGMAGKAGTAGRAGTAVGAGAGAAGRPDLSSWLGSLSREELLGLVSHQLLEDEDWRYRLELRAAAAAADLPAVVERVSALLTPDEEPAGGRSYYGYLEGPEARRFAGRIAEVSEAVAVLAAADASAPGGNGPGAAADVAEHALVLVAAAVRHANDQAGSLAIAASELGRRHLDSCRAGPLDLAGQLRLAGFLAGWLASGETVPTLALGDYAASLGPAGLARLGELLIVEWQRQPASAAARSALIDVLTAIGDVDGLVKVLAADQDPRGHSYLRITAELDMAGRPADALAWAERGLRKASRPDADLARYVAERYCEQGRTAQAETVLQAWFETDRTAAGYRQLRELAEDAGCWPAVRPWALDLLRAQARHGGQPGQPRQPHQAGPASREPAIIDALIGDGDIDGAWTEARSGASERQWLALADLAAPERPAEALAVYRRQIEATRKRTGEVWYERLARLLEAARDCSERLGNLAEFETYLRALRDDQKRKPRLIRVLDAHQL